MDEVKVVQLDTNPAQTSIKELRKQLKAYKDEMANLEEGSNEFLKVANAAGDVRHKIEEINQTVKASSNDFGDIVGNVSKATAGIVGGINAAKGALTLFGVESEEVTKAIEKMQASMAIVQGLSAIDNGIKAFKNLGTSIKVAAKNLGTLKTALISTGIGAIAVAVGELVAHFDDLDKLLGGKLTKTLDGLKGVFGNLGSELKSIGKLVLDSLIAPFKTWIETIKGIGKLVSSVVKGEFGNGELESIISETKDNIKSIYTDIAEDAKNVGSEFEKGFQKGVDDAKKERAKKAKEEADKAYEELKKKKDEELALEIAKAKATIENEKELQKKLIELERQRLEYYKKNSKEYYDTLARIKEMEKKLYEEAYDKELHELEQVHNEELTKLQLQLHNKEITLEQFNERAKELNDTYKQDYIDYLQFLLDSDTINAEQRAEVWKKLQEVTKPTTEKTEKTKEDKTNEEPLALELYSIQDALADLASDNNWGVIIKNIGNLTNKMIEAGKKIKESGEKDWGAYGEMAAASLSMVATILSQFASEEEGESRESFEHKKKLEIGSAVMNMLGGIVAAIASCWSPTNAWQTSPVQAIMAGINAATVAAVGGAQIASIQRQQYGSSSSSSISTSLNQAAVTNTITPPVQYSNAVSNANIEQAIGEQKTYVSVTEIERVGNRVNVAENESRY